MFVFLAFSCNRCNEKSKVPEIVKDVKLEEKDSVKIKIHRYEKALFNINKKSIRSELKKLLPEYSFFIPEKELNDSLSLLQMKNFLTDPLIVSLYDDCIKIYPDLTDIETNLGKAFSLYKFYFPKKKIPEVYSCVSGLDYELPIKFSDSVMVISLDMYLGKDNINYKNALSSYVPSYIIKRFKKDFIIPGCMREIAYTLVDNSKENKNFLDYITYEGKILYFLDATLPDTPDSLKMYYTPAQLKWCEDNEANMWSFIIDRKLLYSTDVTMISKLCSDGPFTSVFSKQSPSRTGIWIGWQIIRKYMEENENVSLTELFMNQDSQDILTKSKYKPRKE